MFHLVPPSVCLSRAEYISFALQEYRTDFDEIRGS